MSHRFGPITQNGYVVPDIEAVMHHWSTVLGVGPWFQLGIPDFTDMVHRGKPTNAQVRIALANSGDLQIELIEPLDESPSPYREFLTATGGKGGLQHVSSWPSAADYDAYLKAFTASGGEVLFQGRGGRTRFVYFDTALDFGTVFEMADLSPGTQKLFDAIRLAAAEWDGQDGVREGLPDIR